MAGAWCSCNLGVKLGNGKTVVCKGPEILKEMEGLTDFDAIVINGAFNLDIQQADVCGVTVKANSEVFDYLDFSVSNGCLTLENKDHVNIKADEFDIKVNLPALKSMEVNGAVDGGLTNYTSDADMSLKINGACDWDMTSLKLPSLQVEVNGAADMNIKNLDTEVLSVVISGAGDVELSGRATRARFEVNGAGSIDARGLQCENVEKSAHGVASIQL